jgi:phosphoribosylformylglycinamidine synthase
VSSNKIGILRFLGTNCDRDVWQAVEAIGLEPEWCWYEDQFDPKDYRGFIVPGGFSHGDYLRCGALAAKAPVMKSLHEAAKKGAPILGICNGFQILCEAQLLPGVLVRNEKRRFIDQWVDLRLENRTQWNAGSVLKIRLPIAHGEGRYFVEADELKRLYDQEQVWWTYENNPNGAIDNIAGVSNKEKNICGLMPHPERAIFDWMGGEDGRTILNALEGVA